MPSRNSAASRPHPRAISPRDLSRASGRVGARLLLFSYGSGAVATAFTLIGREPSGGSALALPPASPFTLERIATTAQLAERLTARTCSDLPTLTRVRARRRRNAARTHAQDRPTPEPCGGRRRVRWHNNGPAREAELAMPVTPCRVIEICHVSGARAARGAVRPGGVRDRCQPHHTHPLHTLFVYHCRPVNRPKVARDAVLTTRDQPRSTEIVGGVRAVRRRRRSGAGDLLPRCGRRAPPPHLLEEVSRRFATPGAPSHSLGAAPRRRLRSNNVERRWLTGLVARRAGLHRNVQFPRRGWQSGSNE